MEGSEKNAETQRGCHRHVLHRVLAAAFPKKMRSLRKVTNPGSHTHLTQSRGRGLLRQLFAWRPAGSSAPTVGAVAFRLASRSLTRHQAQGPRGTAPRSTAR